jgi:transcriptional regulator with XRE-family HTH domain
MSSGRLSLPLGPSAYEVLVDRNPKTSQNQRQSEIPAMIKFDEAVKYLRKQLGLSQRQAAGELGISFVHLNNIENGKASPSPEMLEKFRQTWGIDIYMLAAGMFSDTRRVPKHLREPLAAMTDAWREEIERLILARQKERSGRCLESAN